jgi:peptidoglycan hydrolase CwlO-like protein
LRTFLTDDMYATSVDSEIQSLSAALRRLKTEFQSLTAGVRRLEERVVKAVEQKLDRMALKSELVELKDQVASLTERIAQLEKALN